MISWFSQSGVTFLHVACSGAKINNNILTQLKEARRALERARLEAGGLPGGQPINIDALLISGGANDIAGGFGTIVSACLLGPGLQPGPDLAQKMSDSFDALPAAYRQLDNEIDAPTENTRGTVSDV